MGRWHMCAYTWTWRREEERWVGGWWDNQWKKRRCKKGSKEEKGEGEDGRRNAEIEAGEMWIAKQEEGYCRREENGERGENEDLK